jgi:putative Mg2+ transporter-C (MgtC) family protein
MALQVVGALEFRLGWKRYSMLYEVRAELGALVSKDLAGQQRAAELAEHAEAARHRMFTAILKVLDAAGQRLNVLERDNVAGLERITFALTDTRAGHRAITNGLRESDATDQVVVFRDTEEE